MVLVVQDLALLAWGPQDLLGPRAPGLRGGVLYFDGQFDDARLLVNMAETAAEQGAVLLNYAPVLALTRGPSGAIDGVVARDEETGAELRVGARVVVLR